jgi:hypothetical protein
MNYKALVMGMCVASSVLAAPAISLAGVVVDVEVAPPPVRVEAVPGPRVGYVWVPGYWDWRGHEHVWVTGRWMHERRGWHYVPEHWVQVGPRWHFEAGHWVR